MATNTDNNSSTERFTDFPKSLWKTFTKYFLHRENFNPEFESSIPKGSARALFDHFSFSEILPYRDYLDEYELLMSTTPDGIQLSVGFMISPLIMGGEDVEQAFSDLITSAPPGTVLYSARHYIPDVHKQLEQWRDERLTKNRLPILKANVVHRYRRLMHGSRLSSLIPHGELYAGSAKYYFMASFLFAGDINDDYQLSEFYTRISNYRDTVQGTLAQKYMHPLIMKRADWQRTLRMMLYSCSTPKELDKTYMDGNESKVQDSLERKNIGSFMKGVLERGYRIKSHKSVIGIDDGEKTTYVVPLTVDNFPEPLHLADYGKTIGDPLSTNIRISSPHLAYTIVVTPDQDTEKAKVDTKFAVVAKSCMSESQLYRQIARLMYEQRDELDMLRTAATKGQGLVNFYSGINIYVDDYSQLNYKTEEVISIYRQQGFKLTREKQIGFPIWLCSFPCFFQPDMDGGHTGLQRLNFGTSTNAASLMQVQGDWAGNSPYYSKFERRIVYSGIPLVTRRGTLSFIDIFNTETNYNFKVIAKPGAGKSFFVNEIISDVLSRNGIVIIYDVGASYEKLIVSLGGSVIKFEPDKPKSINMLWGIADLSELNENMDVMKAAIAKMAFPLGAISDWQYQAIENAILHVWQEKQGEMGMSDIYNYMVSNEDVRLKDIADQIYPYAVGRFAAWFNGPREIEFNSDINVVELEALNANPDLRSVVLTLTMAYATRKMYLGDITRPKLLMVDEAYDLLRTNNQDQGTARFIEVAFRRIRKYYGSAGIIVHSFKDATISPAAQAAFDTSEWTFALTSNEGSRSYAREKSMLGDSEYVYDLLNTVSSGEGYSELLVHCPDVGTSIFRFVVDSNSYFTYTTNPGDKAQIAKLKSESYSELDAIEILARDMNKRRKLDDLELIE
jgi:conjugal transfer ATP-binding protein TraC